MSPESLRRFLEDDSPVEITSKRPSLAIPEDIAEDLEDDDNFASSALTTEFPETLSTVLSPPPTQHSHSRPQSPLPSPRTTKFPTIALPERPAESLSDVSFLMPASPRSPSSNDLPSFYHSDDDEDEDDEPVTNKGIDSLATYTLPRASGDGTKLTAAQKVQLRRSSSTVAASTLLTTRNGSPIGNPVLDDLVAELGWMANAIDGRPI
jgi:hypothetical protein